MAQYSEGWITVPGKGKKYRLSDGSYKNSNPYNRFDKPGMTSAAPGFDEGVSQLLTNFGFGGQRRDQAQVDAAREKRNRELLPPGSKIGKLPVSQGGDPTFGTPGINPRTGKPYSESPGKPGVEPGASADGLVQRSTGNGGGRGESRSIPGGGTQTGTNTGSINMPGLEEFSRYAGADIANFAGPSFPTQPSTNKLSANYQNTSNSFNIKDQGLNIADSASASESIDMAGNKMNASNFRDMGGNYASFSEDNYKMGGKFRGAPTPTEGLDDPNKKGTQIDEDMEFGGPDPASYARSNQEMSRRAAFLDASDSMQGLRNVEAGMGMVYAGGKHYANVNGEMKGINSEDARDIKNAAPGKAQALKDKYVSSLTADKSEEQVAGTSADALQAPDVDTSMGAGSEQNKLRPDAFNADGPNFGISPTTQAINVQAPQETQAIDVGNKKNKVNAANFTGGASPFGSFNATKFSI